mmetsp:Transcript_35400/g.75621  ORF Transcript_35400/g.75621 Transcript_35400/m.75621 type:complete len:218 (+) Transcript_35400:578-1231(+)
MHETLVTCHPSSVDCPVLDAKCNLHTVPQVPHMHGDAAPPGPESPFCKSLAGSASAASAECTSLRTSKPVTLIRSAPHALPASSKCKSVERASSSSSISGSRTSSRSWEATSSICPKSDCTCAWRQETSRAGSASESEAESSARPPSTVATLTAEKTPSAACLSCSSAVAARLEIGSATLVGPHPRSGCRSSVWWSRAPSGSGMAALAREEARKTAR